MNNYIKKHCLICENEKIELLYPKSFKDHELTSEIFSARRETEHFHYKIVRCKNCGLVFSREILPENLLLIFYSQSKVTFGEYADYIRKDYMEVLNPFLPKIKKEKALEIGCSNGFFMEELLNKGFKMVYGCEPSIEAKQMASPQIRDNIHTGFFKRGLYDKNSFDLVCSFQTLDHLNDPLDVLKSCYEILKPGGFVYFITHNINSIPAMLFGEKFPIIDVEHIYLFNKKTLAALNNKAGFSVIKTLNIKNTYPLLYWIKMTPLPFKKQLLAFCNITGLSKLNVSIKAGNIGIIAQKL